MRDRFERVVPLCVALVVLAYVLSLAWPALLPVGGTRELAEHFALIDYIEQYSRLPTIADANRLQAMTQEPPGFHWLVAQAGRWSGTPAQRAAYPMMAVLVALKAALLFVITRRLSTAASSRAPFALMAVALAMLPQAFFVGAFVQQSFYSQVAAEVVVLVAWWRLIAWENSPTLARTLQVGLALAACLITWPLFLGPVLIVSLILLATQRDLRWGRRLLMFVGLLSPMIVLAIVRELVGWSWAFVWDPARVVAGAPLRELGIVLLLLGSIGLVIDARRETRTLLFLTAIIALQTILLLAVAWTSGAPPTIAFRMFYLLVSPLAIAGGLALATLVERLQSRFSARSTPRPIAVVPWALAVLLSGAALVPAVRVPPSVVTEPMYHAGMWARENVPTSCVDYVVSNESTAYWLHIAVLRNPPASLRSDTLGGLPIQHSLMRWMRSDAPPYAIIDLALLPAEAKDAVTVLAQFDGVAVVERRGGGICGQVA